MTHSQKYRKLKDLGVEYYDFYGWGRRGNTFVNFVNGKRLTLHLIAPKTYRLLVNDSIESSILLGALDQVKVQAIKIAYAK